MRNKYKFKHIPKWTPHSNMNTILKVWKLRVDCLCVFKCSNFQTFKLSNFPTLKPCCFANFIILQKYNFTIWKVWQWNLSSFPSRVPQTHTVEPRRLHDAIPHHGRKPLSRIFSANFQPSSKRTVVRFAMCDWVSCKVQKDPCCQEQSKTASLRTLGRSIPASTLLLSNATPCTKRWSKPQDVIRTSATYRKPYPKHNPFI